MTSARAARWRCAGRSARPRTIDEVLPAADRAPSAPEPEEAPAYEQPLLELGMLPAPRALPVSRLSYSGLEAYRRCGYRFYLQRALGLAPVATPAGPPAAEPGISALLRGTVVHGLLERLEFARPAVPSDEDVAAAIEQHGIEALPADVADVRGMVERLAGSELPGRIAAAGACARSCPSPSRSMWATAACSSTESWTSCRRGRRHAGRRLEERRARRARAGETHPDRYSTQRIVYALAALRAGAERVEVVHCYLERPDEPAVAATRRRTGKRSSASYWPCAGRGRGPLRAVFRTAFRAMCGLSGPGRAVCARIGAHIAPFRQDPVLMWRPCHCASSSRRKRSGS